jgi:glycosyltransferase involved in cell wall biosynthesis
MSKSSLAVVYGQPNRLSTSFQTRCLAGALASRFDVRHHSIASAETPLLQKIARLEKNAFQLRFRPPAADYVLYCNDGFFDLRAARGTKLLYWYDAPADWASAPPARWQMVDRIRYTNVVTADFVFAVSQAQVDLAHKLRPVARSRVTYLPVGVNCDEFSPQNADAGMAKRAYHVPEGKVIVGYLGRLGITGERYAGQVLLDAASTIAANVDAHFLIVGDGPALNMFRRDARALGLQDRFTFTGFVPQDMLPSCIATMDVCVDTLEPGFHSLARSETKLKQYMAMGRACVATDIGENRVDLADGACGVLCKPGPEALSDVVVNLCRDAARRQRLGQSARERAERFYDWRRLAGRFTAALEQGTV